MKKYFVYTCSTITGAEKLVEANLSQSEADKVWSDTERLLSYADVEKRPCVGSLDDFGDRCVAHRLGIL